MLRVAHYLNQFFGQIGAEDKASVGVSFRDGPVGAGALLQQRLAGTGTIVQTVICGDTFFAEHADQALPLILQRMRELRIDLFVAGPAFKAGRYGMACGRVCAEVERVLAIPTVTGMHPENPGVDLFRRQTLVSHAGPTAASMAEDVERMARLALKRAEKQPLAAPSEEDYVPRGRVKNVLLERRAVDRAVEMLLKKVSGEPYRTEMSLPRYHPVTPSAPIRDLGRATIALVTEGAVVPKGNPDRLESWTATKFGAYSLDGLADLSPETFDCIHGGFDLTFAKADPDRIVPLDVMRELEREGRIRRLFPYLYATCGGGTPMDTAEKLAQGIFADLEARGGAHGVILTAT